MVDHGRRPARSVAAHAARDGDTAPPHAPSAARRVVNTIAARA
ncbi:hypothetical protein BURPS668_2419 [Burkholderia pseudomallei 668]|nr:hypothetical protein BURPS668_2419 [Burkholderia pseudomallei 668]